MNSLQFNVCLKGYLRFLDSTRQRNVVYVEEWGYQEDAVSVNVPSRMRLGRGVASIPAGLRCLSRTSVKP